MKTAAAAMALVFCAAVPLRCAAAQEAYPTVAVHPTVLEIVFAGNDTTQPKVMLREMTVGIGDPADPLKIERSRQGIQDLGLFKSVSVEQTPLEGGVRLTFTVDEKWYFLPTPRLSTNSDGKNSYGLSLRWFNVAGLNHTLRGSWVDSDDKKDNKGRRIRYGLNYSIPFVFDSPYNINFGAGHSRTPILANPILATPNYVETFDSASFGISRTFSTEVASQGWTLGGNVGWSNQDTQGEAGTPAPYGMATALGLSADYRDIRFKIFSEEGDSYSARVTSAVRGVASDYSFNILTAAYSRLLPLGATPHQNLNLHINAGSYHGGPTGVETDSGVFTLGGAGALRGYSSDFLQGDAYYLLSAEYLRPVGWEWLRVVAIAEAGNVFANASDFSLNRVYASVGLGLRVRFIALVNFEMELGVAWPMDGGGARIFASKV